MKHREKETNKQRRKMKIEKNNESDIKDCKNEKRKEKIERKKERKMIEKKMETKIIQTKSNIAMKNRNSSTKKINAKRRRQRRKENMD